VPATKVSARRGFDVTALAALFVLSLRQHLRGRRILVLMLLFLLPSVLAVVMQFSRHPPPPDHLEFAFVFNFIPHALATLTALLYAAGMIQDEVEEQTLTYLLMRPLPRWALYVTKYVATVVVTSVLTCGFTVLAFAVIWWNTAELWEPELWERVWQTAALLALAQLAYCALFGFISLITRRSLIVGLAYIVAFEGLLVNSGTVARQLTVSFYFRVLAARWMNPPGSNSWSLNLNEVPTATDCVLTLLGVSAVLVVFGAVLMQRQEFRMKTPEGS
jgi:ABC-2 type transport system permease protein